MIPSRTFNTVNIPPMSMEENGPSPPDMGMLFFGTGMPIPAMSPMPASPMVM